MKHSMVRILVFSDTHGRPQSARRAIENIGEFSMVVHLGDSVRDALFLKDSYPNARHFMVRGNNDTFSAAPAELIIEQDDVRIFATHGHLYSVKSGLEKIKEAARKNNCRVILFGHTHTPVCMETDGLLLLNPGGYNSFPNPHCGVLELKDGKAYGCLYEIRP